jgi:hypothetical protein
VVPAAATVVAATADEAFAAATEWFTVAVFAVAAKHPVSAHMPATLHAPTTVRARRAGWGRVRRDLVVVIVPPFVRGTTTSVGPAIQRHLGFGEEPDKKSPTCPAVLERFLTISQAGRIHGRDTPVMATSRPRVQ